MRYLFCCVLLCLFSVAHAQQGHTAPARRAQTSHPDSGLAVEGLENKQMWSDFYTGNFDDIKYHRDDLLFQQLYSLDLEAFSNECQSALPANKVEMMRQECARSTHPVNAYGGRLGPDTCVEYTQERTGLYADPAMYDAKIKIDDETAGNVFSNALKMMSNTARGHGFDIVAEGQSIKSDLAGLMKKNACSGPAMVRFQHNLMLYALGKPPLPLPGQPATPAKAVSFINTNYSKFLDDLITDQSKTWMMNRYVAGTAKADQVPTSAAGGPPQKLTGTYSFDSGKRYVGTVTVTFSDGIPDCIYFFDNPTACRIPNRKIAAAFSQGSY